MGYIFRGFFLRVGDEATALSLMPSITQQWEEVVIRLVDEPFVGLGYACQSRLAVFFPGRQLAM
ncbi:hypothetical protein [Dictyobacter kobayashii]|nr:hypothetical protein [Dictyobacter kobayashii]